MDLKVGSASATDVERAAVDALLGPAPETEVDGNAEAERILELLLDEKLSVSDAARIAARLTGGSKNALYQRALELSRQPASKSGKPR